MSVKFDPIGGIGTVLRITRRPSLLMDLIASSSDGVKSQWLQVIGQACCLSIGFSSKHKPRLRSSTRGGSHCIEPETEDLHWRNADAWTNRWDLKIGWPCTLHRKMLEHQLQATDPIANSFPYLCDGCVNTRPKQWPIEKGKSKRVMWLILSSEWGSTQWVTSPNRSVDWQFWGISQYEQVQPINGVGSSHLLNSAL